ncbi:MAG: thymidylate kinase [Ruminococcaceae bacterium]|nr:thymidylate kinase [Oscillospiraceae bacterium]
MGKLIVIEGVDASGKQTQTELLYQRLPKAKRVSFPDYQSQSSALVKMYLNGEFGTHADDVSPEVASVFFACDRYASYKQKWGNYYQNGGIILADRYVTSNLIHQTCKIQEEDYRQQFICWLEEFEYGLMKLPKPDLVVFLDMPPEYAAQLMANRSNKITGEEQKDIHEKDSGYMRRAYDNAVAVAEQMGWKRLVCAENGVIKTPEEISQEVWNLVAELLNGDEMC